MHLERNGAALVGFLAEQHFFEITERGRHAVGLEVLAEATQVLIDQHRVVVDNEYAVGQPWFQIVHVLSCQ